MIPTQEQREAAARAMFELEYKLMGSDWVIPKWDESHRQYWLPLASAALTAAAKVDECTTPTQAQIEAVLRDAKEKLQIYRRKTGDFYDGGVEYTALMKRIDGILAALTAAAEVGDQVHLVSEIHRQHKEIERLKIQVIERDSAIAGWIKREAATIERCAQVAEQMDNCKPYEYDEGFTDAGYRQAVVEIAAAIRALKEKP